MKRRACKRITSFSLASIVAISLLISAAAKKEILSIPLSDICKRTVILGHLRRPIGEEVTVSGYKFTNGPGDDCFFVEALSGEILEPATTLQIPGISEWKDNTKATLRGYEEGSIRFLQEGDTNYGLNDPRFHSHQTIFLHFHVLKVVEPRNLKLKADM